MIQITQNSRQVQVSLGNSVTVRFDGNHRAEVIVPDTYRDRLRGLCGNYDGNRGNEYMKPDGTVTRSLDDFGNSWRVSDRSTDPDGDPDPRTALDDPCEDDPHMKAHLVEAVCQILMDNPGPFAVCHAAVNATDFFDDCVFDMCIREGNTTGQCESLETYADLCVEEGVPSFDWRMDAGCPMSCGAGSTYSHCVSPCPDTCQDPTASHNCDEANCVEGCVCDAGLILSGLTCVPLANCGCERDGRYFTLGESWEEAGELCVCTAGNSIVCEGEAVSEETHGHDPFGKIFSHKFVVPRGDDEAFVEKICRKIPWMDVDNPVSSPPPQSLVSVETAKRRVDQLGECCSYHDVDRAECFDSLRQGSADEYCEHQRLTTNSHLLTEHPCCIQTGTDRLMCIDEMKYAYEEARHAVDYSGQLDDFFKQKLMLHAVEDLSVNQGERMNAADTEQYCARMRKKSLNWGHDEREDIKTRKTECCKEATLDARQRCMQGVFQTQVHNYCAWMDVRAEGDFVTKIDEIAANQPDHVCCGFEERSRYDCFGQLTSGGYNPYVDSRDFTYIINPYKEQYRQFLRENYVQADNLAAANQEDMEKNDARRRR